MRATLLCSLVFLILWPSLFWGEQVRIGSSDEAGLQRVVLQLNWTHSMQFAGYYLAKEKGFYREAGFDVEIREQNPNDSTIELVVSGVADFGVSGSILESHVHEMPVMVLGAVAQQSPFVLIAPEHSGISKLRDFCGKKDLLFIVSFCPIVARLIGYPPPAAAPKRCSARMRHGCRRLPHRGRPRAKARGRRPALNPISLEWFSLSP